MSRVARKKINTPFIHVMVQGVNKEYVFDNPKNLNYYLKSIKSESHYKEFDLLAYCMMNNHAHFLFYVKDIECFGQFMKSVNQNFANFYNKSEDRVGVVFRNRYQLEPIYEMSHLVNCIKYIHNNPVKANICKFQTDYRWSSANAYYGQENPIVNTSFAYEIVGIKESLFRYFATQNDSAGDRFFENDHKERLFYLTDEKALEVYHAVTGLPSTSAADNLPRTLRNNFIRKLRRKGVSSKQVSRLMGVSESTVKRISRSAK